MGTAVLPQHDGKPHLKLRPPARTTSFLSKIPEGSPLYPDAQNGALDFTVTNGHVNGKQVLRNGLRWRAALE